jgi:hypothetical protein
MCFLVFHQACRSYTGFEGKLQADLLVCQWDVSLVFARQGLAIGTQDDCLVTYPSDLCMEGQGAKPKKSE